MQIFLSQIFSQLTAQCTLIVLGEEVTIGSLQLSLEVRGVVVENLGSCSAVLKLNHGLAARQLADVEVLILVLLEHLLYLRNTGLFFRLVRSVFWVININY